MLRHFLIIILQQFFSFLSLHLCVIKLVKQEEGYQLRKWNDHRQFDDIQCNLAVFDLFLCSFFFFFSPHNFLHSRYDTDHFTHFWCPWTLWLQHRFCWFCDLWMLLQRYFPSNSFFFFFSFYSWNKVFLQKNKQNTLKSVKNNGHCIFFFPLINFFFFLNDLPRL